MGQCLIKLEGAVEIEGWEDYYVTPEGKIYKVTEVVPKPNSAGYLYAKIMIARQNLRQSVHRIVAKAFIPNDKGLATVDHIDGDKLNNSVENLQWFSLADNIRKCFRGNYQMVSPDGVIHSFNNINEFAREHGLDNSSVCKVLKGKFKFTKGWTAIREDG